MSALAIIKQARNREMTTAYHFSFFTIAILLLFALFNIKHQFFILAAVEVIVATAWSILILLHHKQHITDALVHHGMILAGFITLNALLLRGGYGNAGIFWMLGFPFLAYFFAGKRLGSYWCAAYILTFFAIQAFAYQQWITLTYPPATLDLIPATLFVFSVLAYFYEKHREEALEREHAALQSLQQEAIQHQRDEHDLLLSQARMKAMMADMREAVFELNLEERITLISPSIQHINHFAQAQVLNMTLDDLFIEHEDTLKFRQAVHHYGQVRNFEVALKSANQQKVFVSINARLSYTATKKVTGIEGIISDITQAKQSADAMRLLIHELRKSRDVALASSHEKTNFLALISHELRTPIHGLMGVQEALVSDIETLNQEQQEYLHASQQATLAISNLIHDIICVSDVEHTPTQDHDVIQLSDFFHEIICLQRQLLKDKGLDHSLRLYHVPSSIQSNPSNLRQVVLNLLSYTIKLAYSGSVNMHVRSNSTTLLLSLDYSGEPFNPSICHKNIQPLQLNSLNQHHLEVSLVRHFINTLHATLEVKSQEFKHIVSLHIPMLAASTQYISASLDAHELYQSAKPTKLPQQTTPHLHILLAEDDKISRIVAVKRLQRAGFHVVAVCDGLEAWQQLQQRSFDLLLTDIRMPKLDGLSLIKKIRHQEAQTKQHMSILGVSAHVMQSQIDTYLSLGMDAFLAKPIEPSQLIAYINQMNLEPQQHSPTQGVNHA